MLRAPTASDRRCAIADWLELTAIISDRHMASKGDLANVFDIADDGALDRSGRDPVTGELLDEEILEEARSKPFQIAFDELEYRAASLGDSYPFEVDSIRLVVRAKFAAEQVHFGQVAYAFCLLATAIRDKKLAVGEMLNDETISLPLHFQVCVCLAAGGYFGGAVCSFGFPRATGDGFLSALRAAYKRFGYGAVRQRIEPGMPKATKDGGVDVIAWLDHPDRMPSKLYSLGQSASGRDWTAKSAVGSVGPFHAEWFSDHPAGHCLPAMYIPFLIHDKLEEFEGDTYFQARSRLIASYDRSFGIIFDRLRIAHHMRTCMESNPERRVGVDGADLAEHVANWVNRAVGKLMARGADR